MELLKELQIEALWFDTRAIQESARENAENVAANLMDLRDQYLDFAHAYALRQHCVEAEANERKDRSRLRAEGHFLGPNLSVWPEWQKLAVNAACMALRNYLVALEPIKRKSGLVPEWAPLVDADAIKKARKAFDARFPKIRDVRNSVAHPEDFSRPNNRHFVSGEIPAPGGGHPNFMISSGGNLSIKHGQVEDYFFTTFDGQPLEAEISFEAVKFLRDTTLSIFEAFSRVPRN